MKCKNCGGEVPTSKGCSIAFRFCIGDVVKILALGITGRIMAFWCDPAETLYRVSFWYDGKRQIEWTRKDEIELNGD